MAIHKKSPLEKESDAAAKEFFKNTIKDGPLVSDAAKGRLYSPHSGRNVNEDPLIKENRR